MRIVSYKDYFFSLRRGRIFESLKLIAFNIIKVTFFDLVSVVTFFQLKKSRVDGEIKNLMIYIPASSGLGDLIMSNIFFKYLREFYPDAKITVFLKNQIFINSSYYDEVVNIGNLSLKAQLGIINKLNIDLILLPEKAVTSSIIFLLGKSKYKLGYTDSYQVKANFRIAKKRFIPNQDHYYLKSFYLLTVLKDTKIPLPSYSTDLSFVKLPEYKFNNSYILFVPCVMWENRSISYDHAKTLVSTLIKSPYHIHLGGGLESKETNERLIKDFNLHKDKIVFHENISLLEFISVVNSSKAVICGDSGPMHIAFGLNKPVLSFWGPTFPELRIPVNKNKRSFEIFEKQNCQVKNCYNMEHKPFCKSCLRLENISQFAERVNSFVLSLND